MINVLLIFQADFVLQARFKNKKKLKNTFWFNTFAAQGSAASQQASPALGWHSETRGKFRLLPPHTTHPSVTLA